MSRKGGQYERDVCKTLSHWWTEGQDDSVFWRTHSSGARATQRAKKGLKLQGQYGDVCAIDERGKPFTDVFTISIKRGYNKHTLGALFDKPDNKQGLREFVDDAENKAKHANTPFWLLIVKYDYKDPMVLVPSDFTLVGCVPLFDMAFACGTGVGYNVLATKLEQFLANVTPDDIIALHDNMRTNQAS